MDFYHTPAIWADFPSLVPGLLLVEGVSPAPQPGERLEPLFARARDRLAASSEGDMPSVQAWRRAFSQMGFKPTQYRSAAEALLRRLRKEGALPTVHPLVDICNAVSVAYALPVAVLDLARVDTFLEVRYAAGDETYEAFDGSEERPEPREVIFADASRHVHARRWTFRQSRRSTVSDATQRALVVSEGLHAGAAEDIRALLEALALELGAAGWRVSRQAILSAEAPRWTDA